MGSKNRKLNYNGKYKDEKTAAHASDTLARKLMANGQKNFKLNFPDDDTEVYPEKKATSSNFIGVYYNEKDARWLAYRWNKNEKKAVHNGSYKSEETAAHASDTLARKLMANGAHGHKLNFPDDNTEIYPEEKTSNYFGVYYNEKNARWAADRWSKNEKKAVHNGSYKDEETAAHASDTLARKLMANGDQNLKLNFPNDDTEVFSKYQRNKRKKSDHEDF